MCVCVCERGRDIFGSRIEELFFWLCVCELVCVCVCVCECVCERGGDIFGRWSEGLVG